MITKITRSKASAGQKRKAAKARRRRLVTSTRALLSTLLFHARRREALCKLKVKDARHAREGVPHPGKGGKTRYLPLHPGPQALIRDDHYRHLFPNAEDDHARFAPGELALAR